MHTATETDRQRPISLLLGAARVLGGVDCLDTDADTDDRLDAAVLLLADGWHVARVAAVLGLRETGKYLHAGTARAADAQWSEDYPVPADATDLEAWVQQLAQEVADASVGCGCDPEDGHPIVWRYEVSMDAVDVSGGSRETLSAEAEAVEEPPEAECSEADEHEWCSPHSVVGGCETNPGVQGHRGGVIITEVCRHCGAYRVTDTAATDPATGRTVESVVYQDADERSLRWVALQRADAAAWRYEVVEADDTESDECGIIDEAIVDRVPPEDIDWPEEWEATEAVGQ